MAQLPKLTSVTIPESITAITSDTFVDCPQLATITVAQNNPTYASIDGVLYNKDLTRILLFPGGTEGVVTLPDQIDAVPASALSYSANLFALLVGKNNATFSTINGSLYSKDASTLVACPGGIGETLTLPKQTTTIGSDALAGITTLKSIVVLGNITTIDPTTFNDQAKQSTTIALPGGEDYAARKQVWQSAGFKNFATPANPGDTQTPDQPGEGTQPGQPGDKPIDPSKPASGLSYKLLEDYTLEASWTGELNPASNPTIPTTAQLAGVSYTVSALAPGAFENQTALTAITLPNSLTTIGSRAFAGTGLATLDIPASITTIGDQAFTNCSKLTRLLTHTNALTAAPTSLEGCTNLEVWCPYNEAETYPWTIGLFATNNHIKAYGLPASQQALTLEVGQSANLFEPGTLQAPDPAKTVYAYEATCLSVSQGGTITAKAAGITTVTATLMLDDVVLAKAQCSVEVITTPTQGNPRTPPDSLLPALRTTLPPIQGMTALMPLAAGDTFTAVAPTGQTLKYTVLTENGTTGTVSVGKVDTSIAGDLNIPETVTNGGVTYIVTAIGDRGFGDSALTAVHIPKTVTAIGACAFAENYFLSSVVLPDNSVYAHIINLTFVNCYRLTHVFAPGNILTIDSEAVIGTPNSRIIVTLPETTTWSPSSDYATRCQPWIDKNFAIDNGSPLVFVRAPFKYTILSEGSGETAATVSVARDPNTPAASFVGALTVPDTVENKGTTYTVTALGFQAFEQCGSLTFVKLPDAVTVIGYCAFNLCPLSSIALPAGLTTIEGRAFRCTSLESLTIPDKVSTIGIYAFEACEKLASITLPANFNYKHIEYCMFTSWGASSLKSIISPGNIETIDPVAFNGKLTSDITITLPAGTVWGKSYAERKAVWEKALNGQGAPCNFKFADPNLPRTVTFNTNGGAPVPAVQSVLPAVKVAKPSVDPTKPNSTFAGWYEDQGVWQKPWDFERNLMPPNDITLYARWTHSVAFNTNGGIPATIDPLTVDDNTAVSNPPDPSKAGYTFGGWYTDAACAEANKWDFTKPVTAHLTLYAKWNLVISVDVPIGQSFSIDAKGGITSSTTPGTSFFASHTVEPLRVSEIACTKGTGADKIFTKATDTNRIKITMAAGTLATAAEIPLTGKWTQPANPSLFPLPAKGKLGVTFGLIIPPDASYTYNATDPGTFATLTYTLEPA